MGAGEALSSALKEEDTNLKHLKKETLEIGVFLLISDKRSAVEYFLKKGNHFNRRIYIAAKITH